MNKSNAIISVHLELKWFKYTAFIPPTHILGLLIKYILTCHTEKVKVITAIPLFDLSSLVKYASEGASQYQGASYMKWNQYFDIIFSCDFPTKGKY